MKENDIAKIVVQGALELHKEAGPGLLESVYDGHSRGHAACTESGGRTTKTHSHQLPRQKLDEGFRADLLVENLVLIEWKSGETLSRVRRKQVLPCLRLADIKLGLLINFGRDLLKANIERLANGLDEPSL